MEKWIGEFLCSLIVTAIVFSFLRMGWNFGRDSMKKEIVKHGYGKFVLKDGGPETEFKWEGE